jgi:divalent metal cation (Fe/Co/Zn/Cd) transporter
VSVLKHVRQSKDPTVKAVLAEDSADLLGLSIALGGIALAQITGHDAWDAGAAILVGCLLVAVAFELGRDTKGLLIGEAAPAAERGRLRDAIESRPEVVGVRELLTMYVGPESLLVTARVDFADGLEAGRLEELAAAIDRDLRAAVPTVTQVFLDPTGRGRG